VHYYIDCLIFNWLAAKINNRQPLHSLHAIIVTYLYNLENLLTIEWTLKFR